MRLQQRQIGNQAPIEALPEAASGDKNGQFVRYGSKEAGYHRKKIS